MARFHIQLHNFEEARKAQRNVEQLMVQINQWTEENKNEGPQHFLFLDHRFHDLSPNLYELGQILGILRAALQFQSERLEREQVEQTLAGGENNG